MFYIGDDIQSNKVMSNYDRFSILALVSALAISSAAAQNPAGTSSTGGNQTADTNVAGNEAIQAGATVNLDVNQQSLTDKWAGFFGTIAASKVLGSGNDLLYEWAASTIPDNSEVIATPQGASAPSSVVATSDPNSLLGSEFNSGIANASRTFNKTDSVDVVGQNGVSTRAVDTFNSSGETDNTFTTFLLENGQQTGSPVYVAEANPLSESEGFTGSPVNYQMLVGVGESPAEETFTFYLELP